MDRSTLHSEPRPQQARGPADLRALACGPLRLVFQRIADRWQHQLEWIAPRAAAEAGLTPAPCNAPQSRLVFGSLEGGPLDDWPPSPPLQELHLEERGSGHHVALLVGMAGASHWSLGVECPARGDGLLLDVACRAARPPVWLGSSYQLGPRMTIRRQGADRWIIGCQDDRACHLELTTSLAIDGAAPTPVALSGGDAAEWAGEAASCTAAQQAKLAAGSWDFSPQSLQIAAPAVTAGEGPWPRTIRWRYAIRAIAG